MALTINPDICPQNHRCPLIRLCPMEAISQNGNGLPAVDESKCAECMDCANFCAYKAIIQS